MAGPHVEHIANMIEECEGMAKIEELQNHENIEIYKLAYDIIEQFFSDEVSLPSASCKIAALITSLFRWTIQILFQQLTTVDSNSIKIRTYQRMVLNFNNNENEI